MGKGSLLAELLEGPPKEICGVGVWVGASVLGVSTPGQRAPAPRACTSECLYIRANVDPCISVAGTGTFVRSVGEF